MDPTTADMNHIKDALHELKKGQDKQEDALLGFKIAQEFLDRRLTQHMEAEEEGVKQINVRLDALTTAITDVVNSMPESDGKPDYFGHRVDHKDLRTRAGDSATVKSHLLTKIVDYAIIIVIVLVGSSSHEIVERLLK